MKLLEHKKCYIFLIFFTLLISKNTRCDEYHDEYCDEYPELYQQNSSINVKDPMEKLNRKIYHFNNKVDDILLKKTVKLYDASFPEKIHNAIFSAMLNIHEPGIMVSQIIRGNPQKAMASFWRFAINSTFGIFGLFDVATEVGLKPDNKEGAEELIRKYIKKDLYIMLPLIGPGSAADLSGVFFNFMLNPLYYILPLYLWHMSFVIFTLKFKSKMIELADEINKNSLDPYVSWYSIYKQHKSGNS